MISKIKNCFSKDNPVWIISSDKGFKRAFAGLEGFNCLDNLKELFDIINEHDEKAVYGAIKLYFLNDDVLKEIALDIKEKITDGEFQIDGMDCDRKGFCEGFDYDEAFIEDILNISISLSSVDDVGEDNVTVTVECYTDISVLCLYDDYENAAWDSEEKEYIFLERGEVIEEHSVEFESMLTFSVTTMGNEFGFRLDKTGFSLELNQWTRTNREFFDNDSRSDAEAETMDAFEEYYKH